MPSQGEKSSELFRVFLELHRGGGVEYEQARALTCFFSLWIPQHRTHPIEKN